MEVVSALRLALADKVGQQRFDLWFGTGVRLAPGVGALAVEVPNQFTLDWLRTHFRAEIESARDEVLGSGVALEFRVDRSLAGKKTQRKAQSASDRSPATGPEATPSPRRQTTAARRRFAQLKTFVVGDCNRVAHTSAEMICRNLGEMSPLFIHGPNGVGKTHLLEGIWSAARQAKPAPRMVYLSAEQFTSYFLQALHGTGLPSFRRKYRGVQLLILDDVQFFAGKRATLVELQHTIDTLLQQGRQLVMAADRPPAELAGLGPELTARMSGGLMCGMLRPNAKTRLGIVRTLARRLNVPAPDNVLKWIAAHLTGDARLFAGALNRLRATSEALKQPITTAMAEEALAEMVRSNGRVLGLGDIDRAVCDVFGLLASTLRSDRKAKSVSYPRMLAMWLARKHTRAALSEISQHFGRRSHSTVISAQKKVNRLMADGGSLPLADRTWNVEEAIRRIEGKLRAG